MHDASHSNVHDTEAEKGVESVFEDDYRWHDTILAIRCQDFSTFVEMRFGRVVYGSRAVNARGRVRAGLHA